MQYKFLIWSLGTIILALVIHISAILAIPYLTENDAWRRLQNYTDANQMRVIGQMDISNQLWAFHVPDMRYALCRYDITLGPVQVDFVLLRGYWSIAIYNEEGKNFYAADGYDFQRERNSLLLLGPEHSPEDDVALPINVPSNNGLVLIRASLDNKMQEDIILETLKKAKCEQLAEKAIR